MMIIRSLGMVVPLDGEQLAVPGHAVAERGAAAAGEERYDRRRSGLPGLQVLLPAGLEMGRIVLYFGS